MLSVVMLVAWSAASVASAMPEDIMSSVNDSSPLNAIHTPIAGFNVDMGTSSYTDNTEERAILVPKEFDSALREWYLSWFNNLPKDNKQDAKVSELAPWIKAMKNKFSYLIHATENHNIFEGRYIINWERFVKSQCKNDLQTARNAMFVMLASHFPGDDLASVLVEGTRIKDAKFIAEKLIDIQVKEWVKLERDPAEVFELLQLHQKNVNPVESPLFIKWVTFVHFRNSYEEDEQVLSVLGKHFNEDAVALGSALVAGTKTPGIKSVASGLLECQVKLWGKAKIANPEQVFELLELQHTKDKLFESPLFLYWVTFLKLRFGNNYSEDMFDFLASLYKEEELTSALVAGKEVSPQLAVRLLSFQIEGWVRDKISEEEVFKLLQLHKVNGDPLERPLFFVWVNFVKLKYESQEEAEIKMFTILKDYCKGDDLAKVLVAATKVDSTKLLAEQRLNSEIDVWVREGRDAASVFKLLELHQTTGNLFASPLFFKWVTYVRSTFSDDLEETKAMISTLRGVYKDDLGRVLAEGVKVEGMKSVAEKLQKALNEEGSPRAPKRHNIDLSEPSSQKRRIDLNEPSAESDLELLNLPPRED